MRRKVVLLPTYEQVLSYRKRAAASAPEGLFGVSVETPHTWLEDAWQRFGDGTKLISPLERAFAVRHVMTASSLLSCSDDQRANEELSCGEKRYEVLSSERSSNLLTDGVITMVSTLFFDAIGSSELERALAAMNSAGTVTSFNELSSDSLGATGAFCKSENARSFVADGPLAELSFPEVQILSLVEPYRDLLSQKGLIEYGDALKVLQGYELPFEFELDHPFELQPCFVRYFSKVAPWIVEQINASVQITAAAEQIDLRFLLATGPSAHCSLLNEALLDHFRRARVDGGDSDVFNEKSDVHRSGNDAGTSRCLSVGMSRVTPASSVLVISHDPFVLFRRSSKFLAELGASCTLRADRPFRETDFGRAFCSLRSFLLDEDHDPLALLDYVNSPFSGIERIQAAQVTSAVQGDRALSYGEAHAMLHLVSPHFDMFEELLMDSDASLVLDYFYDVASAVPGRDAAYRSEQGGAIGALRSVYEMARSWHLGPEDIDFVLDSIRVDCSCGVEPRNLDSGAFIGEVVIAEPTKVERLGTDVFDAVMICDLDSRHYSAGERHDALSTMEKKLGLDLSRSRLAYWRRWFEQVKRLALHELYCERILNSGDDEDVYPSFIWDEFVNCYRQAEDDLGPFGLPSALGDSVVLRDETGFDRCACDEDGERVTLVLEPSFKGTLGDLVGEEEERADLPPVDEGADLGGNGIGCANTLSGDPLLRTLFLSRIGGFSYEKLLLSPSAIEAYVNCPYYWFVTYRLRPDSPQEQLGALEQGTFVHRVFDEFYKVLPSVTGSPRVTKETISSAQLCLSDVFDRVLESQTKSDGVRYVPITPVEREEANKLKTTLMKNIAVQSRLMPSFAPVYSEFEITPQLQCEYAGAVLRGRVDRIDVNAEAGQYAVIDYKGGIAGHDAGYDPDEPFSLPHKIQALIYARALDSILPERPVGALYFSYRAQETKNSVAGSYDASFLDLTGFARKASGVAMNFDRYLALVEEAVASRIADMRSGAIEPRPLCVESCTYCPVTTCTRRLS